MGAVETYVPFALTSEGKLDGYWISPVIDKNALGASEAHVPQLKPPSRYDTNSIAHHASSHNQPNVAVTMAEK